MCFHLCPVQNCCHMHGNKTGWNSMIVYLTEQHSNISFESAHMPHLMISIAFLIQKRVFSYATHVCLLRYLFRFCGGFAIKERNKSPYSFFSWIAAFYVKIGIMLRPLWLLSVLLIENVIFSHFYWQTRLSTFFGCCQRTLRSASHKHLCF